MIPGLSYWLIVKNNETKKIVWEGMIDAIEIVDEDEKIALRPGVMPPTLLEAFQSVTDFTCDWEPVWEDVTPKKLPSKIPRLYVKDKN